MKKSILIVTISIIIVGVSAKCQHGGIKINDNCQCISPWTGLDCSICSLANITINTGKLNENHCFYDCDNEWSGFYCNECTIMDKCKEDTFDETNCSCELKEDEYSIPTWMIIGGAGGFSCLSLFCLGLATGSNKNARVTLTNDTSNDNLDANKVYPCNQNV